MVSNRASVGAISILAVVSALSFAAALAVDAVATLMGSAGFATDLMAATAGPALAFGFAWTFAARVQNASEPVPAFVSVAMLAATVLASVGWLTQVSVVGFGVDAPALHRAGLGADTLAGLLFLPVLVAAKKSGLRLAARGWLGLACVLYAAYAAYAVVEPSFRTEDYVWIVTLGFPAGLATAWAMWPSGDSKPGRADHWSLIGVAMVVAAVAFHLFNTFTGAGPGDLSASYTLILVAVVINLAPVIVVAVIRINSGDDLPSSLLLAAGLVLALSSVVPGWVPPWGNDARPFMSRIGYLDHQAMAGMFLLLFAAALSLRPFSGGLRHARWAWGLVAIAWAVSTWRHTPHELKGVAAPLCVLVLVLMLVPVALTLRASSATSPDAAPSRVTEEDGGPA